MKNLIAVASLSALVLGAAIPAHASTFATIAGAKVSWTRSNGAGALTSTGDNTFDFLAPGLPSALMGKLVLSLGETGNNAQTFSGGGTSIYIQNGIAGTFNEIYEGQTETVRGITLTHNLTSLLSGTISNGTLVAVKQTVGLATTSLAANLTTDVSNYVSPFIPTLKAPESLDITIALASGNWGVYTHNSMSTLNSFSGATASGNFLAEGVTEPAGWALMLSGIGMTGGILRRRRVLDLLA